jgi:predicted HicB family RNase H-like nuclease
MTKKVWAKGRREATHLVRLEPDIYQDAKNMAEKEGMTLKAWISLVIRRLLLIMSKEKK